MTIHHLESPLIKNKVNKQLILVVMVNRPVSLLKPPNSSLICQLKLQLRLPKNLTTAKVPKVLSEKIQKTLFTWRKCCIQNFKPFLIFHLVDLIVVKPFQIGKNKYSVQWTLHWMVSRNAKTFVAKFDFAKNNLFEI